MRRIYVCVAVVLCFCLAGCGGGGGELNLNLVRVEGTVTLDGSPLANKGLMFTPQSGDGVAAGGTTDAGGKYTLTAMVANATSDQEGVPPGQYKVSVFEPMITVEGEENMEMIIPGESQETTIPLKYHVAETTDVVVTVPDAGGTVDIKLSSEGS